MTVFDALWYTAMHLFYFLKNKGMKNKISSNIGINDNVPVLCGSIAASQHRSIAGYAPEASLPEFSSAPKKGTAIWRAKCNFTDSII